MPTVTETPVAGYASCPDALCPGYEQEVVGVLQRVASYSFQENGGDAWAGEERSTIAAVRTIEPGEADCPHCGKQRIVALEERPEYAPISGQDPLHLLNMNKDKQVREVQRSDLERQVEMANMRAEMAEMKAELQRRRGGRPPKEEGGE